MTTIPTPMPNNPALTFNLGPQNYALLIEDVVEVASMIELMTVADAPPEILGVANWHGTVLPMLDLRQVFGQPVEPINTSTVFIIAQHGEQKVGLVVDEIHQVDYIDLSLTTDMRSAGKYIRGIISYKGQLLQIIALAPLLAAFLPDAMQNQRG
jgi:purine-binding chemotaxis protein CheW